MKKLMNWMTNVFVPKASSFAKNPWISAIQDSMISIMPIILINSFITILSILSEFIPDFPDFSFISNFTFGLSSLFVAYLVPTFILEKSKLKKYRRQAGLMGVSTLLMMSGSTFDKAGNFMISMDRIGSGGLFVAFVAGMFVALIMKIFSKKSMFKKETLMHKFLIDSFDSMAPILVIALILYILVYLFKMDIYAFVNILLMPLTGGMQTFGGFVFVMFLMCFFYSFGLSPWLLTPVYYSVGLQAIGENATRVTKGLAPTLIATNETFGGWIWLGGTGCTLVLCIMFLVLAKSQKLKGLGKATILPAIFNINEPVVFGAIVFNPILMVPMWLCGLIIPTITYLVMNMGMVTIPFKIFQLWYVPIGIQTYLTNYDLRGLVLLVVLLLVSTLIYFPFFKVYDKMCLDEEKKGDDD